MNQIGPTFVAIVGGVLGLALVAVALSQKAQTSNVLQASGSALANIVGAAVSPITGASSGASFGSIANNIGGVTG